MPRDSAALLDMANAARLVVQFAQGLNRHAFLADVKTQSAVLHQLLILGEATKRLSMEFCAGHPEIPWSSIAGMRDRLIHGYNEVDLSEVWKTAERDVPNLLSFIERILPGERE